MLELNPAPSSPDNLVKDSSDAGFMVDVIEASQITPVIVDFWAPWCGPCKALGPILEAEVKAAKGKLKLVKIDIDQNPAITGQLQVRSIPMVYAFKDGRPFDGFQGNVTPAEVKDFVARVAGGQEAGGQEAGLEEAVLAAEEMLAEGATVQAIESFGMILGEAPENTAAYSGLIRAYLAAGDVVHAEGLLKNVSEAITNAPEIDTVRAQVELAKQGANARPLAELAAAVKEDPKNAQVRFDYAVALHAAGRVEDAINELITLFKHHPEWNDGAPKTQLFKIFEALKPEDPLVLNGRRKLSSMIFR